jgi:hypothetical protein
MKNNTINEINEKNKIKHSALCCVYCGKAYKTKQNLDKHLILCEIYNKSKNRSTSSSGHSIQKDEEDEIMTTIPSSKIMYQIVMELSLKYNNLETKLNEMRNYLSKKIKKIDIFQYLNDNNKVQPTLLFDHITEIITIEQSDIEYLFNNSYIETLNHILSKSISSGAGADEDLHLPIAAFRQKPNTIYIYTKINDQHNSWILVPKDKFIRFLNIIQFKISKAFSEWRKNNSQSLNEDDNQCILYDKTFSKLMGPEFKTDTTYNKYYSNIYHKIKKDMNVNFIEYEL